MAKALFLDRDGVININHGYVYKPANFDWIAGIFELIKRAKAADFLVIVVTNQSGIGRGMYSEKDFHTLTAWMMKEASTKGADIDDVFYCPHHPSDAQAPYLIDCECRKPKTGMLKDASEKWGIDMHQSVMVGDKKLDMDCAIDAGLAKGYWFADEAAQALRKCDLAFQQKVVSVSHLNAIEF